MSCTRGVYTFGCNDHGQLGLGSLQDAPVPVRVKSLGSSRDPIVQVAAGLSHTLFISESNRVWAAGLCDLGQFKPLMQPSPTGSMPTHSPFHSMPVRVQLPFLHPGDGPGPQPLLHEAKAGGHASVFLIRAQDEPVRCKHPCSWQWHAMLFRDRMQKDWYSDAARTEVTCK